MVPFGPRSTGFDSAGVRERMEAYAGFLINGIDKLAASSEGPAGLVDRPDTCYTVEEAVALVAAILRQLESVEDFRLRFKWWLGHVLTHTQPPRGQRSEVIGSIVDKLWENHGIRTSRPELYRCEKVYRRFEGNPTAYLKWIEDRKVALNRPVYWSEVLEDVIGGRNNPSVVGPEEADRLDYVEVERAMDALERIMLRAREGEEEAIGALEAVRQSIDACSLSFDSRRQTPRGIEYLDFVRGHPCIICRGPAEAHHAFGERGTGMKSSDYSAVPLCDEHHRDIHRCGRESFDRKHDISLIEVAFNLLHRYATGEWVTMRLD